MTVVCAVVAVAAIIMTASVSPSFCLTCHGSAGEALRASEHADTSCDGCHLSRGALGVVENRLRVVAMVAEAPFAALSGESHGGTDGMDNRACLDCHAASMNDTVVVNGIRMNHRAPQDQAWLCTRCHAGTAHAAVVAERSSYTMDGCLSCHSAGTENLSTCTVCHPENEQADTRRVTAWRVTHGSNWQKTHGMGDLKTCKVCHGPDYCVACHGMRMPHVPGFLSTHGTFVIASENGDTNCLVCHQGKACEVCHGLEMPHPEGFMKEHKTVQEQTGKALCERCHKAEQCTECHTRHTHPGIPEAQLKRLKDNLVDVQ